MNLQETVRSQTLGSTGCVIGATYSKTKLLIESAFPDHAYAWRMRVGDTPRTNIYTIGGYYILLRSFDNIQQVNGIEYDWLWADPHYAPSKQELLMAITGIKTSAARHEFIKSV